MFGQGKATVLAMLLLNIVTIGETPACFAEPPRSTLKKADQSVAKQLTTLEAIQQDLEQGIIDKNWAAIYAYYATTDRTQLPARYKNTLQNRVRCNLPYTLHFREAIRNLSEEDQSKLPIALTDPCDNIQCEDTFDVISSEHFQVHYPSSGYANEASRAIQFAEEAWHLQVDILGFAAPLSDQGCVGDDERFDIFLECGSIDATVEPLCHLGNQTWNNVPVYMLVQLSSWGGDFLETTIAHEFNHACQFANDTHEIASANESTSTLLEETTDPCSNYYFVGWAPTDPTAFPLHDFNTIPHASFECAWATHSWVGGGYGSVMQLLFYRDRYFNGDAMFIADIWRESRDEATGPCSAFCSDCPQPNTNSWFAAVTSVLEDKACVSYEEALIEFSRWRWFVGNHDDGQHFAEGAAWPDNAQVPYVDFHLDNTDPDAPRPHGMVYLRLQNNDFTQDICFDFDGDSGTNWHIETMRRGPNLADEWCFQREGSGKFLVDPMGTSEILIKVLNLGPDEGGNCDGYGFDLWPSFDSCEGASIPDCEKTKPLKLLSVESEKGHPGQQNVKGIPAGNSECRDVGYGRFVFKFNKPVKSRSSNDFLTAGDITISSGIIPLSGVVTNDNGRKIIISPHSFNNEDILDISFDVIDEDDNCLHVAGSWTMLIGDVDNNGVVTVDDRNLVVSHDEESVSDTNFRFDVNHSGTITATGPGDADYDLVTDELSNAAPLRNLELLEAESLQSHFDGSSAVAFGVPAGEVECRTLAGGQLGLRFEFNEEVTSIDDDDLDEEDFLLSSGTFVSCGPPDDDWHQFEVVIDEPLAQDPFRIRFQAKGPGGDIVDVHACWALLLGDVTGDGVVDSADTGSITSHSGQTLTVSNFRNDLDLNREIEHVGFVNYDGDIAANNDGNDVPLCCN